MARPRSAVELAGVMADAAAGGDRVVVRGRGTKLGWGTPPSGVEVLVDVSRMDRILEHAAGDLVVRVEPGVTLDRLADALRPAGQRLVLHDVVEGSTVGGVVATALSGPLRLGYASVRDLVLGVTVVMADGSVARSGGKVVKNVAGYDLGKLYTGSYGTLGVIAEVVLRLHPEPEAAAWVVATYDDGRRAAPGVAGVLDSQAVPAALEVDRPGPGEPVTVAVALEGSPGGVAHRAERVATILGPGARVDAGAPPWWGRLPGPDVLKVTCAISAVPSVVDGLGLAVRASAGSGIVYAAIPADQDGDALTGAVSAARRLAAAGGGFATVLGLSGPRKAQLDVWGPVPGLELMRRLKDVFDPDHRLAPGRFAGGI